MAVGVYYRHHWVSTGAALPKTLNEGQFLVYKQCQWSVRSAILAPSAAFIQDGTEQQAAPKQKRAKIPKT